MLMPPTCHAGVAVPDAPRIAHIGIAVERLDEALQFYRDVLGLTPHPAETADGATIVSLPFGDAEVELLEARDPDSPIARFIARRGPGIHHVCYRVPDLDAALRQARDATLGMPRLILPSLQINMRAGQMPEPEDNGLSYLKLPLNGI